MQGKGIKFWWLDSFYLRKRCKEKLPILFFLVMVIYGMVPIVGMIEDKSFSFKNWIYLGSILRTLIFYIGISFLIYIIGRKDLKSSLALIKMSSILQIVGFFSYIVQISLIFDDIELPFIYILRIVVLLFFIVASTERGSMKKLVQDKNVYADKIFVSYLTLNLITMTILEVIRVNIFYQNVDGFGFTSNATPTYILYLILIAPLFLLVWFINTRYEVYRNVFVLYAGLMVVILLGLDITNYRLSLVRYYGDAKPFDFLEMIGSLNSVNFFMMIWGLIIAKIIFWKKEKKVEYLDIEETNYCIEKDEE